MSGGVKLQCIATATFSMLLFELNEFIFLNQRQIVFQTFECRKRRLLV